MSIVFPNQINSTYVQNGFESDITGFKTPMGKGVVHQHNFTYNIVPQALNTTSIAGTSGGASGTQTPYQTTRTLPDSGQSAVVYAMILRTGVSTLNFEDDKFIAQDCSRVPIVTFAAATTADTNVYITGLDNNFKTVADKITLLAGSTGNNYFNKSFLLISDVYFTSDPGVQVSIGRGNVFGLPHYVPYVGYINNLSWNNAALDTNNFISGLNWRQTSNTLGEPLYLAPTVTSEDSHGTIDLSTQASLPNGVRLMSANYYVYGTDDAFNASAQNAATPGNIFYGSSPVLEAQFQLNNSGTNYVKPYFIEQDLTGAQYPADQVFMTAYRLALEE